jgi:hypothetical protein
MDVLVEQLCFRNVFTDPFVQNACLPLRYLAMDVPGERLCCGNVFTDPLRSNGYTRHNSITATQTTLMVVVRLRRDRGLRVCCSRDFGEELYPL